MNTSKRYTPGNFDPKHWTTLNSFRTKLIQMQAQVEISLENLANTDDTVASFVQDDGNDIGVTFDPDTFIVHGAEFNELQCKGEPIASPDVARKLAVLLTVWADNKDRLERNAAV